MFSKLKIKINIDSKNIGYNSGSLFQGFLMENIMNNYADHLHNLKINPYSQYIERSKYGTYWNITTTNREAYEKIIIPLLSLDEIIIKDKDLELKILDRNLNIIKREDFIEKNLFESFDSREINFKFLTPTAFKKNNRYVIIPEPGLIFQSLIRKFDSSGEEKIFSYDLLEEINNSVYISRYNLKSKLFYLEKTKIPGFIGSLSMRCETNKEIINILKLLNKFSEYSGTGIKSSMGMGGTIVGGERLGWKKNKIDNRCGVRRYRRSFIYSL